MQILSADGSQIIANVVTVAAQGYVYSLPAIAPGEYIVTAGTDRDSDSSICDIEDACAVEPAIVTINSSGDDVADVDFLIVFGIGQPAPPVDDE